MLVLFFKSDNPERKFKLFTILFPRENHCYHFAVYPTRMFSLLGPSGRPHTPLCETVTAENCTLFYDLPVIFHLHGETSRHTYISNIVFS